MKTEKKIIATENAPAAVGPYSQAIAAGELVFTAGQIPLDPESGQLVPGDIEAQTHRALQNLQALLQTASSSLAAVMKTTVFMTDLADFKRMNTVYAQYFVSEPPARSTVQVAALPLGAQIEIECVALAL
ncbi:MAG: RidA family protein [Anaerolineales bacterium]|jgi:2-iminobutanoate/2-iminopropanoate deaminase|nr:RidA family protein [Anaerolineales bacterium]MDP7644383.1 RidA family protein [Anaerolineales bacterium]HJL70648.1 RidA family protein [Anaerolineales bacterium]HJN42504.1 RidA family protein [Anaerolineales bacterium]|tara:strand:+ start:1262 stop:1651 length:390 start_codon:yes stop_codon:yes gene_type:complete